MNRYLRGDQRDNLLAEVASLYYLQHKTQAEIAAAIGVTRSAVSRMLAEARERGIVEVRVRHPLQEDPALAGALMRRFGLHHARVLAWDGVGSTDGLRAALGRLAARLLRSLLVPGAVLGVGWGTTVSATIEAVEPGEPVPITVVQLVGVLKSSNHAFNAQALVDILARKMGGESVYLYAPFIVDSAETARALRATQDVREALEAGRRCAIALTGIGTTDPAHNSLYLGGHLSYEMLRDLQASGAVGDVIAHHYDERGRLLDLPLHGRLISIDLDDLRAIPTRLAVAGGMSKAPAILGALRGGYVNVLVTDSQTAAQVLALANA